MEVVMRKKFLSFLLALAMVASAGVTFAFAEGAAEASVEAVNIVPNMEFTGTTLSLSLNEAVKRMTTTGPGFESANLRRQTSEAQAKGQEELWNVWRHTSNAMASLPAELIPISVVNPLKTLDAKIVKMTRPYLLTQASIQYEIDVNLLAYDTVQAYHRFLQAEEALRIAKENLQNEKNILSNTNKKLALGVVSKVDTMKAESAVQDATVNVEQADTALRTMKMSFNQKMNLPLMQNVKLTDTLKMSAPPTLSLKAAIERALAMRNELKQVQYVLDKANIELSDKFLVSRYSAEYLTAALAVTQAEKSLKDTRQLLELEVRSQYMSIQNLASEISALEATVANAKEAYRLADLSFTAGMNTLVDVQAAQVTSYQAQLGLASKVLEYNLAVNDFDMITGYGKGQSSQSTSTTASSASSQISAK
jgi:hypothetical protein